MLPVMSRGRCWVLAAACALVGVTGLGAQTRQIDSERSKLTVYVYKSGLFSAFADDHIIQAPIARGSLSDTQPLAVDLLVHAADLKVLDPNLAPSKRAEVQTRMLSAEVLDTNRFADITFASDVVEPMGADRWRVSGRLTIHGRVRPVTLAAARQGASYRGSIEIKQRDFDIKPISIAGGTVKVKDQIKIEFEIIAR